LSWLRTRPKPKREAELLFRGRAYQRAIRSYTRSQARTRATLEVLCEDPRFFRHPHLRSLYSTPSPAEPGTLLRSTDGGIAGIASSSDEAPLKRSGFDLELLKLEGMQKYSEWQLNKNPLKPVQ